MVTGLPYALCILLLVTLLLVIVIADFITIQQHEKIDELALDLSTALAHCAERETLLSQARSLLSECLTMMDKTGALKRELEATRAELASAVKNHQQEQANSVTLEAKLKESEKTVRLLGKSNARTREQAQNLLTQKLAMHNQLAGYTAQLRSARADVDSHKDVVGDLQQRVGEGEQERDRLAEQLASERGDGLDLAMQVKYKAEEPREMTKQLEESRQKVKELGESAEKAWAEVRAWREDPICMVRKAEEWKAHLAGEPLLGEERDRDLSWDVWMRMEEERVGEGEGNGLEGGAGEEVVGEEEFRDWTEIEEEWGEDEDEDSEASSHL